LNPTKYLRRCTAGVASFLRLLSLGARGIIRRRDKTTVVICPVEKLPAEVEVDPDLQIESCTRRPESEDCSEPCVPQVQFSTENLHDFAARYEGKKCASCGATLTRDDWYKNRLAAIEANPAAPRMRKVVRQSLPSIPATNYPICSACHGAETHLG